MYGDGAPKDASQLEERIPLDKQVIYGRRHHRLPPTAAGDVLVASTWVRRRPTSSMICAASELENVYIPLSNETGNYSDGFCVQGCSGAGSMLLA